MSEALAQDFRFDIADPAYLNDRYTVIRKMLANDPMHRGAHGFWVASRYADVKEGLFAHKTLGQGDFETNIKMFYGPDFDVMSHSAFRWLSDIFVMQDPPKHTRLRGLVTGALTAKRIEAMRPRIQALTDQLLDSVIPNGGMELIQDFAYKVPTLVMCDMLGIRDDEYSDALLKDLTQAIADSFIVFETRPLPPETLALADRQMDFLVEYFTDLLDRRRKNPQDDLATALANARDGNSQLSPEEINTVIIGLFGAGFETTAHMIGNGIYLLHRYKDQWERLKREPGLAVNTVEEVLRYESSIQFTFRAALEDTELAGETIRAGERVILLIAAANRDPEMFQDPDTFDIARKDVRPLTFGGGIHYCVGAQLARIEGQVVFETVSRRLPDMQVETDNPDWRDAAIFRGLNSLRVTW